MHATAEEAIAETEQQLEEYADLLRGCAGHARGPGRQDG